MPWHLHKCYKRLQGAGTAGTTDEISAGGTVPAQDMTDRPLTELLSLEGRVAVVTGGARGIGLACARRLAEMGAEVFLGDIDAEMAASAAAELAAAGFAATGVALDATDIESLGALADLAAASGRLDVWVSNAGIYRVELADDATLTSWSKTMDLNIGGVYFGAREAAKRMRAAGNGGVIINMASTNAWRAGGPGFAAYVTSKSGVVGLTKSLAIEFAPQDIRVIAVAPSLMATEGIEEATPAMLPMFGGRDPKEVFINMLPVGRMGVPDDVARVVAFLATDAANYMTGSTIPVDGGSLAG